ncbi:FAD/NAD(P)-binding domain-containing protein [Cytidiella melzeri]|nr:FAD/NAD(P)-binding domain-containing protein [Cytidiella melzeri]
MYTSPPPRIRVAICGAGVAGLTLAVLLSRSPHISVDIYEAASELKELGAGIGMWPRTWKIIKKLGLHEALGQKAIVPAEGIPKVAFHFRRGDLPQGHTFQTLVTPGGLISIHRPDFQAVLLDVLGDHCRTWTGKRLVSYTTDSSSSASSSRIQLQFADGTTAGCDFLVGCDGVKSVVRAGMVREAARELREKAAASSPDERSALMQEADEVLSGAEALWSGTFAYRAAIRADEVQKRWRGHRVLGTPHVYLGKNTQMTIYPMARGTLVNLAAFRARYELENSVLETGPMVSNVSKEQFKRDFEEWEDEVQVLIDCLETTSRWAVHVVKPLSSFVSSAGNVAVLGDAAHAMMPYQGSGAGQAIEDAYILGILLTHPLCTTPHHLPRVAQVYDAVRRPVAQHVASVSRDAGLLYTLNYPGLTFGGGEEKEMEGEKLEEVYARIRMNWEWAWDTSVDGDVERAVRMFEGGGI